MAPRPYILPGMLLTRDASGTPRVQADGQACGRLDEVAWWAKVLTSTERTRLYNSGNGTGYP